MEGTKNDQNDVWTSTPLDDGWMYRHVMNTLLKRAEDALQYYASMEAEVHWLQDRGEIARQCLKFLRERNLK